MVIRAVAAHQARIRRYQELLTETESDIQVEAARLEITGNLGRLQTLVLRRLTLRRMLGYPEVSVTARD